MSGSDKIIVTNLTALKKKYGRNGLSKIRAAIRRMITADKARGLQTRLLALDSASDMKKVKGTAVADFSSTRQNKAAIDAVFTSIRPDYLMILGATDVIPHQDLLNPAYGGDDIDEYAYGDIPYACEQAYSQRAEQFIGPTRVVGRLPDVTAGTDPAYLIALLDTATKWTPRQRSDYAEYFAVSAAQWANSTTLSVQKLFGSDKDLNLSPTAGPKWSTAALSRRAHFINCHGGPADPQFYGQKGKKYPVAHHAALVAGKIAEGTVAAVECCYGGELYDANLLTSKQQGMCNTYLAGKTYGYFASSTIAYGPAEGNGSADLLCQYFLGRVLAGASLGRAGLEARQEFAQAGPDVDPFDIKTLAQFSLFGDPSIHPVAIATPHQAITDDRAKPSRARAAKTLTATFTPIARAERRKQLLTKGLFVSATQPVARRLSRTSRAGALTMLRRLARDANIANAELISFNIELQTTPARDAATKKVFAAAPAAKLPQGGAYHVAISSHSKSDGPVRQIKAVIAKEFNGKLVSYRELLSR
ncbi:MAG TPA: hypothetical protein VH227_00510 [Candidatus Udaeobacter sp.]|jgi:hypothetical protein|nr:hypothetical protein [Candidatus Udaeobacter sp.]